MDAIHKGRAVRALTAMLDRVYAAEQQDHVEEPTDLDKLADLTREQRRALYRRLVSEGRH